MPQRNPRPCASRECSNLTIERYCDQCTRAGKAKKIEFRPSARERGYDSKWEAYRLNYLRVHRFCVDPFERHDEPVLATRVDHIIPHKGDQNLFWKESNYQGLCESCHNHKTAKFDGGFGRNSKVML